jgi:hypothetical protein
MKAGVIPNDGWDNVLGIIPEWVLHRKAKPGVVVIMADERLTFRQMKSRYIVDVLGVSVLLKSERELEFV